MNDADASPITIDERLRAALLWDWPVLLGRTDVGSRQWRDALQLSFTSFGELVADDLLSLAAHVVRAVAGGDERLAAELRETLGSRGPSGELFGLLLGLALTLDDGSAGAASLAAAETLVADLDDADLRVRLQLRLMAFAELRGERDLARRVAERAVADTTADTRLGVVARRWASELGIAVEGFSPWASTDTPEDALLAKPWIQRSVIAAASALAAKRFEAGLAGVWDSGFHIGRTRRDDLFAAHLQAEWCGDIELRSQIRRLLTTEILEDADGPADRIRWALEMWASEPSARRVPAAVRRAERQLDAPAAAELLATVRAKPVVGDNAGVDVAAGVWDLLDDEAADDLLQWLVHTSSERSPARRDLVLGSLLWRRPGTWADVFAAAPSARAGMLGALHPHDLAAAPAPTWERLVTYVDEPLRSSISAGLWAALRYVTSSIPVAEPDEIDAQEALELADWSPGAVTQPALSAHVAQLVDVADTKLRDAATGVFGLGGAEVHELLGRLAGHLAERSPEATAALLRTLRSSVAPARSQLGALEGLVALRRVGRLDADDLAAVRDLRVVAGQELLGEDIGDAVLRADQLRVLAPDLGEDDVAWLAVCSRGSDVKGRLVAMAALGAMGESGSAAVDWSLVAGLFDPSDDVVVRAVGAIGQRGVAGSSGALPVVRERLLALAGSAGAAVRRVVVVTAVKRAELELAAVVEQARADRAWTVRREAERAPAD